MRGGRKCFLKYKIATVHGIVKVLAAQILHCRGVKVETSDVGVIDGTAAGGINQIGAVRCWQCVQSECILALGPCQTYQMTNNTIHR